MLCQCPVSGGTLFYAAASPPPPKTSGCQCPVSGGTLFYSHAGYVRCPSLPYCVNALYRAGLFSTYEVAAQYEATLLVSMPCIGRDSFLREKGRKRFVPFSVVSMPCIGRDSFLPYAVRAYNQMFDLCQCPVSGGTLFYMSKVGERWIYKYSVSMPCIGRDSFLRDSDFCNIIADHTVSMPCIGRDSFLQRVVIECFPHLKRCQCPVSGGTLFYWGMGI